MADIHVLPRHLHDSVVDALAHARVVLLNGPRQAGKTTLVSELIEREGLARGYLTLDDAAIVAAARRDPGGFVAGLPELVVIDEVQLRHHAAGARRP